MRLYKLAQLLQKFHLSLVIFLCFFECKIIFLKCSRNSISNLGCSKCTLTHLLGCYPSLKLEPHRQTCIERCCRILPSRRTSPDISLKWYFKTKHSLLRLRKTLNSYVLGRDFGTVLCPILKAELAVPPFREVIQKYVEQI